MTIEPWKQTEDVLKTLSENMVDDLRNFNAHLEKLSAERERVLRCLRDKTGDRGENLVALASCQAQMDKTFDRMRSAVDQYYKAQRQEVGVLKRRMKMEDK